MTQQSEINKGQPVTVVGSSQFNTGGYTPVEQQGITRPENTTTYAAGDIIVGVGTAPLNIFNFTKASPTNGYIVGAKLTSTDTGITGSFTIHLVNAIPATYNDNGAFTLTAAEMKTNYIGKFNVIVSTIGGIKSGFPCDASDVRIDLRKEYYTNGLPLYAIIQTDDGFTPSAVSTTFQLTFQFENNIPNAFPELF